ncbi:MAG: Ig-like domain-containing protein, partial [Planctomycetaceae bacterium]
VIAADGRTPDPLDLGYDQGTSGGFPGSFTNAVDLSAVIDPLPEAAYRTYSVGQTLAYAFDGLAAGAEHRVRLHFVEHVAYLSPRRMNVRINGTVAQAGLDIRAEAGALFKAVARDYPVTADANGRIAVALEGVSWSAVVSAIEVFSGPARIATSDSGGAATGTISVDAVAFENRGVLWASSAETLRLAGGWTNLGTVTAFPGGRVSVAPAFGANLASIVANVHGTLNLEGSFPTASIPAYGLAGGSVTLSGALDNSGATLRLDDTTGPWHLLGGSITGGRYEAKGSARLVATSSGGRLSGLTLAGDLDVTTGSVSVSGGISLESATVRIGGRSTSDIGAITFDGGSQKIDGTGEIIFGQSPVNRMHLLGTAASQTLTIEPGIVIRGNGGTIEGKASAPIQLVNKGTIVADAAPPFPSDPGYDQPGSLTVASQGLVNEGTLGASGGGTLLVSSASIAAWTNPGTIAVDRGTLSAGRLTGTTGTVTVSRGTLSVTGDYVQAAGSTTLVEGILDPSGAAAISGGTLGGSGTVKADLTSAGTIVVGGGGATGTLAVEGAFTQGVSGALRVEIGWPASDLLRVTGAAVLGGTLDVGVIDAGSLPLGRTVYDVLRHASVSGAFAAVSGLVDVDGRGLSMETAPDRLSIVSEARDAVPPTLVIAASRTDIRTGETAAVTFTLSEDATDFTAADVAVTGGALSAFAGSGKSYTALFTPSAGFTGAGSIAVAAGAFVDAAGNANLSSASPALSIDTLAPTIRITASPTT